MSDSSSNSVLSARGILELKNTAREVNKISPDIILLAPLERTLKTFEIINEYLSCNAVVNECSIWLE